VRARACCDPSNRLAATYITTTTTTTSRMHTEIQVALRFVISFLYNKLPRRRVNLFGEELEAALRDKFQGHWYPDKPFKGSAYRCLKITDPADPVLNRAARESGNPVVDIIENLPADLAVWIDPGEVSYRMGEKGAVKILYSEKEAATNTAAAAALINNEEMSPDARGGGGFLSLDCTLAASLNGLSLSQNGYSGHHSGGGSGGVVVNGNNGASSPLGQVSPPILPPNGPAAVVSSPAATYNPPGNPFQPRQPPVVYTAATFAQTKFGSTKLKTNSKKPNRMSPTEFSNYIKQRALQKSMQQQQQQQQQVSINYSSNSSSSGSSSNNINSGSNSPAAQQQHQNGFFDKFYGSQATSNYFQNKGGSLGSPATGLSNNTTNNMNYNIASAATTFHKSLSSPGGTGGSNNDYGLGLPLSASNQNLLLSPSLGTGGGGFSLSDYSSLLADWPDNEAETTNSILQDILASAAGGGTGSGLGNKQTTAREEWTTWSYTVLVSFLSKIYFLTFSGFLRIYLYHICMYGICVCIQYIKRHFFMVHSLHAHLKKVGRLV
jgi:protein Tob/BTG